MCNADGDKIIGAYWVTNMKTQKKTWRQSTLQKEIKPLRIKMNGKWLCFTESAGGICISNKWMKEVKKINPNHK